MEEGREWKGRKGKVGGDEEGTEVKVAGRVRGRKRKTRETKGAAKSKDMKERQG